RMHRKSIAAVAFALGVLCTLAIQYVDPLASKPRRGAWCAVQLRGDAVGMIEKGTIGVMTNHSTDPGDRLLPVVRGIYQRMDSEWLVLFVGSKKIDEVWIPRRLIVVIEWPDST